MSVGAISIRWFFFASRHFDWVPCEIEYESTVDSSLYFFARKGKIRTRNSYHCWSHLLNQRNFYFSMVLCISIIKSGKSICFFYKNRYHAENKCTPNIKRHSSFKDLISQTLNVVFGENSHSYITGMQLVIETSINCCSDIFIFLKHFTFWI